MSCKHCKGTLQVAAKGPKTAKHEAAGLEPLELLRPCRACLTVPACDELRAAAKDWLGFTPWDFGTNRVVYHGGSAWFTDCDRMAVSQVPAYLPAGRDLLLRTLASDFPTLYGCPRWEEGLDGWILTNRSRLHAHEDRLDFVRREVSDPWHGVVVSVPALGDIPADASPDLRAARALVLAWEASSG